MSIDRSLKIASGLSRHRNVLTRAERIAKMQKEERWDEKRSVLGLPKISNRNLKVGKKAKKKEEAAEGAAPAAAAAPAASAQKKPGGK